MATVKCALGKRGRPSHEWKNGEEVMRWWLNENPKEG